MFLTGLLEGTKSLPDDDWGGRGTGSIIFSGG